LTLSHPQGAKSDDSEESEGKEESSSSSSSSSESNEDDKEESTPAATSEPEEGRKAEDIPESEIAEVAKDSLKKAEVSRRRMPACSTIDKAP
jgi:hypothetical protein